MRYRLQLAWAFLRALPRLPGALWSDRDYFAMMLLGRPVGRKARADYEAHLADVERWRKDLYS